MALTPYQAAVLALGPTSFWPLDDATGSARDISGNGHTASVGAGVKASGVKAPGSTGAMMFDGSATAVIGIANSLDCSGARSWIAWANLVQSGSNTVAMLMHSSPSAGGVFRLSTGGVLSYHGVSPTMNGTVDLRGSRHMVGLTIDGSGNGTLYADGLPVMTGTGFATDIATGNQIGIGNATQAPLGLIDDVASFAFALTAAQMLALYRSAFAASRGFFDIFASS